VNLHLGGRREVLNRKGIKCIFVSYGLFFLCGFWGTRRKSSMLSYLRVRVQPGLNGIIRSAALSKSVCEGRPLRNYFSNANKVQGNSLCVVLATIESKKWER